MENQHSQPGQQPHTIRLGSAWESPPVGQTVWVRRFGRPSGIGPGVRIVLVVDRPAVASLVLNDTMLPAPAAGLARWTHDITALLEDRNELRLTPFAASGPLEEQRSRSHGRASLPEGHGVISLEILTLPPTDR